MANAHKHKQRVIRGADDQLWEDLDAATKAVGTDRSAVTREYWEWYVGRPGAKLPKRPPSEQETDRLRVGDMIDLMNGKKRLEDLSERQLKDLEALAESNSESGEGATA